MKAYLFVIIALLLMAGPVQAITWTDANGCWTATNGQYIVVKWNATGNSSFTIPTGVNNIWYTVVGGGASGGHIVGGGGGGGGVLNGTLTVTPSSVVPVSVGEGGPPVGIEGIGLHGINGTESVFSTIEAKAGGFGGAWNNVSGSGANGGGGSCSPTGQTPVGLGILGMGFDGGYGWCSDHYNAGGAAGAGSSGENATSAKGGNGGNGNVSNITGTPISYGSGGGGSSWWFEETPPDVGIGGDSCGGNGSYEGNATGGTDERGCGGGGSNSGDNSDYSGKGGSGVVIIAYIVSNSLSASFTQSANPSLVDQNVTFTDTSTGNPTTWNWSFDDGNTSTLQNAIHAFPSVGNYTVYLNVTNSTSWSNNSALHTVTTNASALAMFTQNLNAVRIPNRITFTDASTGATSWDWSFGDGTANVTTQSPVHQYVKRGVFRTTLIVDNGASFNTSSVRAIGWDFTL
jgi:PKD repeat protein